MPFPEGKKVKYRNNLLNKVICQLRFPTILQIESEPPTNFQNAIREIYPLYDEKIEIPLQIRIKSKGAESSNINQSVAFKNHEFSTEDRSWTINLTKEFIALSTEKYISWADFIKRFMICYNLIMSLYKPPFITRTGLRYIDIIDRARLGLDSSDWKDLVQPYILGILSDEQVGKNTRSIENVYDIELNEKVGSVRLATSLIINLKNEKPCFMIDSDFFFIGSHTPQVALDKLNFFHIRGARLIQWAIKEKLHLAMGPQPYEL